MCQILFEKKNYYITDSQKKNESAALISSLLLWKLKLWTATLKNENIKQYSVTTSFRKNKIIFIGQYRMKIVVENKPKK